MNVLIACEVSGVVRDAFKSRGVNVWSCDIKPTQRPGQHIQGDVLNVIKLGWDMLIAFPPCTHLAGSGAKHFKQKIQDGRQSQAIEFFMELANSDIEMIAIENPVGIMSTEYRPPDQIIQPYYFGDPFQKRTCLWLKNLPRLFHAAEPDLFNPEKTHVEKGDFVVTGSGKKLPKWYSNTSAKNRGSNRSKTFPGIASAMAEQWI